MAKYQTGWLGEVRCHNNFTTTSHAQCTRVRVLLLFTRAGYPDKASTLVDFLILLLYRFLPPSSCRRVKTV